MKRFTIVRAASLCVLALLLFSQMELAGSRPAGQDNWTQLVPEGEDFAAMIPAKPTVRSWPVGRSTFAPQLEQILDHHDYGGYGDGLVFVIESYKAERPQRLWNQLLKLRGDQDIVFEREIAFDGVVAKQYRSTYSTQYAQYTRRIVRFVTNEHVYFLTLATREPADPVVDRFLSSFRLRQPQDQFTPETTRAEAIGSSEAFNGREVTRKATVVWKPEPTYTALARSHQVVGTVVLRAVFAADGYVTNITATKELKDGLTEAAITAARNIRFFPAEKDGKPVSQWLMLEYNFNLY